MQEPGWRRGEADDGGRHVAGITAAHCGFHSSFSRQRTRSFLVVRIFAPLSYFKGEYELLKNLGTAFVGSVHGYRAKNQESWNFWSNGFASASAAGRARFFRDDR